MEDGLVQLAACGRKFALRKVLILVVMEDGLVPFYKLYKTYFIVLILVVMEDGLVPTSYH